MRGRLAAIREAAECRLSPLADRIGARRGYCLMTQGRVKGSLARHMLGPPGNT
jgi:hypothetical protein